MKILITIALTALALGLSILSINYYVALILKHRDTLSSTAMTPMYLVLVFLCFLIGVVVPMEIVGALNGQLHFPAAYERVSEVVWLLGSFAYAASRLIRGFISRR